MQVSACVAGEAGSTPGEASSPAGGQHASGGVRLHCPARREVLLPEQVSAELLRHLLDRAEAHLGSAVTNAVGP